MVYNVIIKGGPAPLSSGRGASLSLPNLYPIVTLYLLFPVLFQLAQTALQAAHPLNILRKL